MTLQSPLKLSYRCSSPSYYVAGTIHLTRIKPVPSRVACGGSGTYSTGQNLVVNWLQFAKRIIPVPRFTEAAASITQAAAGIKDEENKRVTTAASVIRPAVVFRACQEFHLTRSIVTRHRNMAYMTQELRLSIILGPEWRQHNTRPGTVSFGRLKNDQVPTAKLAQMIKIRLKRWHQPIDQSPLNSKYQMIYSRQRLRRYPCFDGDEKATAVTISKYG